MRNYLLIDNNFEEVAEYTPGCWVNVECPDNNDISFLTDGLGIPREIIEYISDIDERPRIEIDTPWVLTILRIPARCHDDRQSTVMTVPIGVITGENVTVTVCNYRTELISDFIKHSRQRAVSAGSQSIFILRLIYSSCFWFLEYLKAINLIVSEAEKALRESVRNSDLLELMKLQKTLVYFNTSLRGNEVLIGRLRHVFTDNFDLDLLEDVEIEQKQALNTVNVYSEILMNLTDTYASVISNNVNAVMKRMTGTTIVLMIPTIVASFYGMNVVIGLGTNPYGFWIVVGIAVLLTVATFLVLRFVKWF